MRLYLPFSSFIGYFRRCECSVMPCSRTAAPLAQCAPRLSGESNTGSCRTHTPFCTTASMAQPTEQWVQTVRLISTLPPADLSLAASARPIMLNGPARVANEALAPTATPERLRKERRSMVLASMPAKPRDRRVCAAGAFVDLRVSNIAPPQTLVVL